MDKVQCPVCSKEFLGLVIQEHVTRCLFLSEPTESTKDLHGSQKRPASFLSSINSSGKQKSPVLKKAKSEFSKSGSFQRTTSSPTSSAEKTQRINSSFNLNSVCEHFYVLHLNFF